MGVESSSLPPGLPAALVSCFESNRLMLFASAISFQVFTAIVPFALFVLGLMGALDLRDVWLQDVRHHVVPQVSPAMLAVIDDTVSQVFDSKQLFWITAGFVLAVWQTSGGVRAAMDALNEIYHCEETRGRTHRYLLSMGLAAAIMGLLLAAAAMAALVPVLLPEPSPGLKELLFAVRWAAVAGLLCLAVGLIVHQAPDFEQPLSWVSAGVLVIVVSWTVMSGALLAYLLVVASYGSLFGNLATVVVLAGWIYASAVLFLAGLQIDALLRHHHGERVTVRQRRPDAAAPKGQITM